ncbi:MAG: cation:proton antiporter domain-containing protein [Acidimicrobiales bacterium]
MLTSLSEHQLLVFFTQLFVLLVAARVLGSAARRIGQPSVVGEIAAGVLLGPSIFGNLWPAGFEWFLPDDPVQSAMLLTVGWLGVVLLLLATGFETDLALIRRMGRAVVIVGTGSLIVPFAMGLGTGWIIPDEFVGEGTDRVVFALFLATALSISSLPVIAKILGELGLIRRNFAQLTLAAGMANDVVGWILLGVIAALATSGVVSVEGVLFTLGAMAVFLVASLTIGQRIVDGLLRRSRRQGDSVTAVLSTVFIVTLAAAAITQAIEVEAVLGAFVAGIVLGRSRFGQDSVVGYVESIASGFLAPIFFATAGLRVDLSALGDPTVIAWTVVVVAVASISKLVGSYAGARLVGLSSREGLALGAGLNARGALEIIIATIGLSLGVLSDSAYTVVVVMAIATTVMAPVMLRKVVTDWEGDDAERSRLAREESMSRNVVVRDTRLLVATQGTPSSIAAAQLLQFAWPNEAAATVVVAGETPDDALAPVLAVLDDRDVEVRRTPGVDPGREILAESRLGYGVIALGASSSRQDGTVVSPLIDRVLTEATVPVVIVRRGRNLERDLPGAFTRAVVPVTGSRSSRAAQEVAGSLSTKLGTEIVLSHVQVARRAGPPASGRAFWRHDLPTGQAASVGGRLLDQASLLAAEVQARWRIEERSGPNPGHELVELAREVEADLIVMGASVRRIDDHPFLGHTVEAVLDESDATVAVVVVPSA